MRSRFTAHVLRAHAYLDLTSATSRAQEVGEPDTKLRWERLEVIEVLAGAPSDDTGIVEFRAFFSRGGLPGCHHERSTFIREDGQWRYADGVVDPPARAEKVGRNAPCPCGSGKKFKKCCGGKR